MHVKHNYLKIKLFISLCIITNIMVSNNENENIWDNYFNDTIYNIYINYYFLYNIEKAKLHEFSKNKELRFLKYNSNNLYKLLLKSKESGFIIKQQSWDYYYLKYEYDISIKLKKIINFIDYICYFEFEEDFINYISNNDFSEDINDNMAIVLTKNYNSVSYLNNIDFINICKQLILSLYCAYYTYNIYFNYISIDDIYIIKNNKKFRYKYYITNKYIILNNCYYKIIISNYAEATLLCHNFNLNFNTYIIDIINKLIVKYKIKDIVIDSDFIDNLILS